MAIRRGRDRGNRGRGHRDRGNRDGRGLGQNDNRGSSNAGQRENHAQRGEGSQSSQRGNRGSGGRGNQPRGGKKNRKDRGRIDRTDQALQITRNDRKALLDPDGGVEGLVSFLERKVNSFQGAKGEKNLRVQTVSPKETCRPQCTHVRGLLLSHLASNQSHRTGKTTLLELYIDGIASLGSWVLC